MTIEAKLDLLQSQLNTLCNLFTLTINSLSTKKEVARFLNKSSTTISNYIANGTFIEDKHYFYNEKKKIEFIPSGIVEFKQNPKQKIREIQKTEEQIKNIPLSETSSKILKGIL